MTISIKKISFIAFCLLLALSALRAEKTFSSDNSSTSSLALSLSDADAPHTLVFDKNNTSGVTFTLPTFNDGGSWVYDIYPENESLPASLLSLGMDIQIVPQINDFTGRLDWISFFNLTCIASSIGNSKVIFYYYNATHQITDVCKFEINVVAPTSPDVDSGSKENTPALDAE